VDFLIFGASSKSIYGLSDLLGQVGKVYTVSRKSLPAEVESARHFKVDCYDVATVSGVFASVQSKELVVVISNGVADTKAFYKLDQEEIANIAHANYILPLLITNVGIKARMYLHTKFVYISSARAQSRDRGIVMYSSSKAGLEQAVKCLAYEYGQHDKFFYVIALGLMKNGMADELSPKLKSKIMKNTSFRELITVKDVFAAITFISSNKTITGSVVHVTNGHI
jgi:3-oxoacyl-[acyl-carrier protein] reductase